MHNRLRSTATLVGGVSSDRVVLDRALLVLGRRANLKASIDGAWTDLRRPVRFPTVPDAIVDEGVGRGGAPLPRSTGSPELEIIASNDVMISWLAEFKERVIPQQEIEARLNQYLASLAADSGPD